MAAIALISASLSFLQAPAAQATEPPFFPVTAFNIDGNPDGPNDWAAPYGAGQTPVQPVTATQPVAGKTYPTTGITMTQASTDLCGNNDNTGFPKSQAPATNPWSPGSASPNKKSDLCAGGTAMEIVNVDGQFNYIYYAFWARNPDSSGDMSVFTSLEGALPGRFDDTLISFDYAPADSSMTVTTWKWQANGGSTDPADPGVWVLDDTLAEGEFQYGIGGNYDPAYGGAQGAASATFAEVAVNLTSSGIIPSDTCTAFRSGSSITKTGNSMTAQLQDYLTPIQQITFNSCNSLVIHKETLPAGTPGGPFPYVVDQAAGETVHDATLGFDAGEPDTDTSLTSISNTLTVPTDTTDTWRNVIGQPDYQIAETELPIDWSYQSLVCSYYDVMTGEYVENRTIGEDDVFAIAPIGDVLNPNPGTECTITNATSALTVVKQGAGGSDTFTFNVTNKDAFGLQLGQSSDPLTFTPGTAVTITETMPTTPSNGLDWVSYGAECRVEGAPATDPPLATATAGQPINVTTVAGENVICTFINQQQAGLRVTKNIDPDDTDEQFAFTWAGVPGATSDTLGDGASSPVYVVAPSRVGGRRDRADRPVHRHRDESRWLSDHDHLQQCRFDQYRADRHLPGRARRGRELHLRELRTRLDHHHQERRSGRGAGLHLHHQRTGRFGLARLRGWHHLHPGRRRRRDPVEYPAVLRSCARRVHLHRADHAGLDAQWRDLHHGCRDFS